MAFLAVGAVGKIPSMWPRPSRIRDGVSFPRLREVVFAGHPGRGAHGFRLPVGRGSQQRIARRTTPTGTLPPVIGIRQLIVNKSAARPGLAGAEARTHERGLLCLLPAPISPC